MFFSEKMYLFKVPQKDPTPEAAVPAGVLVEVTPSCPTPTTPLVCKPKLILFTLTLFSFKPYCIKEKIITY